MVAAPGYSLSTLLRRLSTQGLHPATELSIIHSFSHDRLVVDFPSSLLIGSAVVEVREGGKSTIRCAIVYFHPCLKHVRIQRSQSLIHYVVQAGVVFHSLVRSLLWEGVVLLPRLHAKIASD